ncbi:hypothetical protein [Desulfofalx alkaliphila]|uniref:hypothetical protein n=1 Tax=Desulfofalx alkaliphila TaxID=105483 RepID=UPI0004E0DE98|nr:hypothetical protein [Desulfofalx alkaliphila]
MKKLPGSLVFLSAGIYLATQGSIDVITLLAVLACIICGALALTRHSIWALAGGIALISTSLVMQAAFKYLCEVCLKADILILGAVICISLVQRGKNKIPSMVLSGAMTAIMFFVVVLATPVGIGDASSTDHTQTDYAQTLEQSVIEIAQDKPVLIYNPNCGPCGDVVDSLVQLDPKGQYWQPMHSGGDTCKEYLQEKGYQGEVLATQYMGPVPALVINNDGDIETIRGHENIVKTVQENIKY